MKCKNLYIKFNTFLVGYESGDLDGLQILVATTICASVNVVIMFEK